MDQVALLTSSRVLGTHRPLIIIIPMTGVKWLVAQTHQCCPLITSYTMDRITICKIWSPCSSPISPIPWDQRVVSKLFWSAHEQFSRTPTLSAHRSSTSFEISRRVALRLNLDIQFRDDHGPATPIPNDLIDPSLQRSDDAKYYCFYCSKARLSPQLGSLCGNLSAFFLSIPQLMVLRLLTTAHLLLVTMIALISANTLPFARLIPLTQANLHRMTPQPLHTTPFQTPLESCLILLF
jgi:hypothetical protein